MSYREGHEFSLKGIDLTESSGVDFGKYSTEKLKELWRKTME
ncbi:MAG: glycosyl hydrolase, partial [Eudoraea sp.]|nr:glycosyl hydrolase [Eudoraea sp.]